MLTALNGGKTHLPRNDQAHAFFPSNTQHKNYKQTVVKNFMKKVRGKMDLKKNIG